MEYVLTWTNYSGIKASGMEKWIIKIINDKDETVVVHEDDQEANLKDFEDVKIKILLTEEQVSKLTPVNTIIGYFDTISEKTKLASVPLSFDKSRYIKSLSVKKTSLDAITLQKFPVGTRVYCKSNDPVDYKYKFRSYKLLADNELKLTKHNTVQAMIDCKGLNYTGVEHNKISTNGRCGIDHGNTICPGAQCCSKDGWCGGEIGNKSDWCSVEKKSGNYTTWVGDQSEYDGIDINKMSVNYEFKRTITQPTPSSCYGKKCPGYMCCNQDYECGGDKTSYSRDGTYCTRSSYGYYFMMPMGDRWYYDGDGTVPFPPPTITTQTEKDTAPLWAFSTKFKCASSDPFSRNNFTYYTWDQGSEELKTPTIWDGVSFKSKEFDHSDDSLVYTLPSCDGIKYGGRQIYYSS